MFVRTVRMDTVQVAQLITAGHLNVCRPWCPHFILVCVHGSCVAGGKLLVSMSAVFHQVSLVISPVPAYTARSARAILLRRH